MLCKEVTIDENNKLITSGSFQLGSIEHPLPLDNLDENIVCKDALFADWPKVDAIIGNPPYQAKNKMQEEFGPSYVKSIRKRYPEISGRADYCVYWFRRAHDELPPNGRAGLVGTNTIRQNFSREGGLDYIVYNNGTITEAVSSQVWSGDAVVHVSIVNWIKGKDNSEKMLFTQLGDKQDSEWASVKLSHINSSLSNAIDVASAGKIEINTFTKNCFQGQTHGNEGFLLTFGQAKNILRRSPKEIEILFPYATAEDLLSTSPPSPKRCVIDLNNLDINDASTYKIAFGIICNKVLPQMEFAAKEENNKTGKTIGPRQNHFKKWWKFWRDRPELISRLSGMERVIVCARVTKRPIFEFMSTRIRPNDALMCFAFNDDYSFGIIQSIFHWAWFVNRCSTLKRDFRYTSESVFDTFPWPQTKDEALVESVARHSKELRDIRWNFINKNRQTLRDIYKNLELPGKNILKDAHNRLNEAVAEAYGIKEGENLLEFLLNINKQISLLDPTDENVNGPGLPQFVKDKSKYISNDCIDYILDEK